MDAVDVDRLVDGIINQLGVMIQFQILQQIGRRAQHGDRIGNVLARYRFARIPRTRLEDGVLCKVDCQVISLHFTT